jgi:glycosyltransferase involved in cell wall biosynthesis
LAKVSVVIPAKNEAAALPAVLARLSSVLTGRCGAEGYEIVVVDDGSTDATADAASKAGARVVRHPYSMGNGAAVKAGMRAARGDVFVMMDADGQHAPEDVPMLLDALTGYAMVVGARTKGTGTGAHRGLANAIYNALASYVVGRRVEDLTSGFRAVAAEHARRFIYLLPNTFSYPTTITMSMLRGGWSVGFHPFQVRARKGKSHVRLVADGSRFFLIILRIATMFAPLRVFLPASLLTGALGLAWYVHTWFTDGRLTNMAVLLMTQAGLLFALGLIAEQIAALRFQNLSRDHGDGK